MAQDKTSLDFDRRCLADLGLTMPRATKKYLAAVDLQASLLGVSAYFVHLAAARYGANRLYKELNKQGYQWRGGGWRGVGEGRP